MRFLGSHICSINGSVKAGPRGHPGSIAVNVCCCTCVAPRVPPVPPSPGTMLPCCCSAFIEIDRLLLALEDSALRPVGLLWPLLTSPAPSRPVARAVVRCSGQSRRPLEVRRAFFSRTRRIYRHGVPNDDRASPSLAGLPHHTGLVSACCTSRPRFRHQLSSDPASRRAPLPRRMVPVITVHRGLSPPECTSLLDTPGGSACPITGHTSFPPPLCRPADGSPAEAGDTWHTV